MLWIANLVDNVSSHLWTNQIPAGNWPSLSILIVEVRIRIVVKDGVLHLNIVSCLARHQSSGVDVISANRDHTMIELRMTISIS